MEKTSESCIESAKSDNYKGTAPKFPFLDIHFQFSDIRLSAKIKAKIDLGTESFISEVLFLNLFPGKEIQEKSRVEFFLPDKKGILNFVSLHF